MSKGPEGKPVADLVKEYVSLKKKKETLDKGIDQQMAGLKKEIFKAMDDAKTDVLQVIFAEGEKGKQLARITRVKPQKVEWHVDKAKEKFDKKDFDKVAIKTYTIPDWKAVVKFLKSYGVPGKEFVKFISVTEELNINLINQLYELGIIHKEDLEGIYEVIPGTEHLRLTFPNEEKEDNRKDE